MNEYAVYITGSPGFKPTLIKKLGRAGMPGSRDIGPTILSLSLPENATLEDLKASIGTELLTKHDLHFFDELPSDHPPYTQLQQTSELAFKMSIWVNRDSRLTGNAPGSRTEESKP